MSKRHWKEKYDSFHKKDSSLKSQSAIIRTVPSATTPIVTADPKEITARLECSEGCPDMPWSRVDFDKQKWEELQFLMTDIKTEFACYLLGTLEGTRPMIDDYYIPEQEASYAFVEITEDFPPEEIRSRIIGHLHSHHTMGAFHSGTDEDNMNWPINIVISTKGYVCTTRRRTACGRFIRNKAEVWTINSTPMREIPGRENIKRKFNTVKTTCQNPNRGYTPPKQWDDEKDEDALWLKLYGVGGEAAGEIIQDHVKTRGVEANEISEGDIIGGGDTFKGNSNLIQRDLQMVW